MAKTDALLGGPAMHAHPVYVGDLGGAKGVCVR
eukprot:CAMPEP_0195112432 /NCGR_PEP_ID=MMETSP0448-20130528/99107_1 /TAXON_ID=66468 /ORGANISM="Heterocapsa triquestra, Strain CCMP 448" /LENGTH=32 /DNA_ID= /DNA_START= /DNA_END= /DNA_ORIENTATION=